jgi:hypothetical protein
MHHPMTSDATHNFNIGSSDLCANALQKLSVRIKPLDNKSLLSG